MCNTYSEAQWNSEPEQERNQRIQKNPGYNNHENSHDATINPQRSTLHRNRASQYRNTKQKEDDGYAGRVEKEPKPRERPYNNKQY